jgi:thiamine-monophosphate kinase
MDVSDGLVQDLGHLARAGGCAAVIEAGRLPLSPAASAALAGDPGLLAKILSGGDDYELLFAAAPADADQLCAAGAACGVAVTCIGRFTEGEGVTVLDGKGAPLALPAGGWSHF